MRQLPWRLPNRLGGRPLWLLRRRFLPSLRMRWLWPGKERSRPDNNSNTNRARPLLTPEELADAAPFYLVLRDYIGHLKEARETAGLTLADVSARSGMAVESLSRLETGAQTNPTWKTLGAYAAAVGCRPRLTAEVAPSEDRASHIGELDQDNGPG